MKTMSILPVIFAIILLHSCTGNSPLQHRGVVKAAGDFVFTEGPASDRSGNVYFSDIPNNKIHILTTGGELTLFRDSTGGANGLFFDREGNLIVCEGNNRQVSSISPGSERKVLASHFQGKRFNRPNDLWIDPEGGIYFSDPAYGVDSSMLEMELEGVYYINPERDEVIRVCDDLIRPNGIIGTSDGKKLYVTDHYGKMTWEYQILSDGTLTGKKAFVPMGCDGLTIDAQQHVYLTNMDSMSIDIFSAVGEKLLSIPVPERPTNVCFGGADRSTLFITATTSLYAVRLSVKGVE